MKPILTTLVLLAIGIVVAEIEYRLPPITYTTAEEQNADFLNDGKILMDIKGIPDESETLVCTNWICPTSIVVNAVRYNLVTNEWMGVISADVTTTNLQAMKKAHVRITRKLNAKETRRSVFASYNQSDSVSATTMASFVVAHNLDPSTNIMVVFDTRYGGTNKQFIVYRNLTVRVTAPTNAVDFATAIINEGLPEAERIPLPPAL